jgi:hypothetical protein
LPKSEKENHSKTLSLFLLTIMINFEKNYLFN